MNKNPIEDKLNEWAKINDKIMYTKKDDPNGGCSPLLVLLLALLGLLLIL